MPTVSNQIENEDAILSKYNALAYCIARRFHKQVHEVCELEDLVQQASMGILEAARTFDESRGTQFITHAYNTARYSTSRWLEKNPGVIRSINPARDGIPTIVPLESAQVGSASQFAQIERSVVLDAMLEVLEPEEREVCLKIYRDGLTAREVAQTIPGATVYKIQNLKKSALTKLRDLSTRELLEN